ncbi:MAG TPA: cell wall hydrolase [Caulobacteraceae bacterium]|nr:cell wall hydrolase [Caulobacteraceae bacterium]
MRVLIGGDVTPADDQGAVVRLGPADADWNAPDQAVGLPLVEMRGLNGRLLWSRRRVQAAAAGIAAIRPSPGDDLSCLTQAVYYEARSQSVEGQEGVAQVVMNRTRAPGYASSVCGVVYQRTPRTCQFSFVCDGSMERLIEPGAWRRAQDVAAKSLGGFVFDPLKEATHYHADYVTPDWSFTHERLIQIGAHIFYR